VVVLAHAFWQRWFAGDPDIVGRTIILNGHPYTVIGVTAEEFRGVSAPIVSDAWVPLMMMNQLRPELSRRVTDPAFAGFRMVGRLREGVSAEAAQRELTALTTALTAERGEPASFGAFDRVLLRELKGLNLEDDKGVVAGFLGLLLGASALVLLIASVNIASMLSARAIARRRELAVRAALGAGRGRLARQLLTEILVLFVLGAVGGVVLAFAATGAVERVPIPLELQIALELSPDMRVMLFALFVSLATGLAFGLPPALRASREDITSRLRDDTAGSGTRRSRFANALIVSQLAAALVLLVAAGLFMRALNHGTRTDPGFDAGNVATFTFFSESWGYDRARTVGFFRALRKRVEALPGVTAASYTVHLPLTLHTSSDNMQIEGSSAGGDPVAGVPVWYDHVDAGYFELLRIPLRAGRAFAEADDLDAPRVAVVNESFSRKYFPGGSAIGRSVTLYGERYTIVGIAGDAKYSNLTDPPTPFVYFPVAQGWATRRSLIVRTAGDPALIAPAVHGAIREIDPGLPRVPMVTLRDANSIVLFPQRIAAMVTGALGAIGLLLASVGLYGIIAYSVTRRTREIGIRLALGAHSAGVVGLIVREGMRLAVVGVVLGVLLAAAVTQLIAKFLFTVSPLDAATFGGMSALFIGVALLASWLPARRAAAADPAVVLRAE
jgi:predicted permease